MPSKTASGAVLTHVKSIGAKIASAPDQRRTRDADSAALPLMGLEVLAFIGAKIAVPILVSFVSRDLYDRYQKIANKTQLLEAENAIQNQPILNKPVAPKSMVVQRAAEQLHEEGLSEARAAKHANAAYEEISSYLRD
jgi:hypothetical protein